MGKSKEYMTKTLIIDQKNPIANDDWYMALDIGFSAVKGFSNNKIYCFPAYARRIDDPQSLITSLEPYDILYKDNSTGEVWAVGDFAQKMITSNETSDSEEVLYNRNRYDDPIFRVLISTGMAIGMQHNRFGGYAEGQGIKIQTGLPPKYIASDGQRIIDAFTGVYDFSLKIGTGAWTLYRFEIKTENMQKIMAQPMGTLFSISTSSDGTLLPEAKNYFGKNVLIFDGGFGTLDTYNIRNKSVQPDSQTFDNLGMKRVFQETVKEIGKIYHTEIKVAELQNYLENGEVKIFEKNKETKKIQSKYKPFEEMLIQSSMKVCDIALDKCETVYNNLFDHDYLVVTGGTGEAWLPYIQDRYAEMQTLKIINGNRNNTLPFTFSNVRGYYLYMINAEKRKK